MATLRTLPGSALDARSGPVLRPIAPGRCTLLPVRASMPPSVSGPSSTPARPSVSARAQSGTPPNRFPPPPAPGGVGPGTGVGSPGLGASGPGMGTGGGPGMGAGGSGQRPVNRGSAGGGGGGGGAGGPPPLPSGWSWDRVLLTLLGIALAVPAWKYVNRRYLLKPEPEHTLAKVEDKAAEIKTKATVSKVVSAVKEKTVDPVADTLGAGVQAVKHSDAARTVQHKAEDIKDALDVGAHDAAGKAERRAHKATKEAKHAVEHAESRAEDIKGKADQKAHEAAVKGGRAVQRAKEKVSDAVYEAEAATGKATKGVLENIKSAAHTVGRKLHVVADSTEKGLKKGADSAEKATGTKTTGLPTTSNEDRTKLYTIVGGTVIGTGVLAAALYYWDRKGGDLKGKVKKLQDRTKEAADKALHRTQEATDKALHRTQAATEPAKPPSSL